MSNRIHFGIVQMAALLLLSAGTLSAQTPGADCSYLVVNHSYANTFGGFLNVPEYFGSNVGGISGIVPNAGAGVTTFLPGEVVKNTETIVIGLIGIQPKVALTGTYNLRWDTSKTPVLCTGPVHMTVNGTGVGSVPPVRDDFQVTVTGDGRVEMIHTNPGLIVDVVTLPANSAGCRNKTIAGKYTYTTRGWGLATPDVPTEQTVGGYITAAMSGAMQFSPGAAPNEEFVDAPPGSAAVSAWDTLNINGATFYRKMAGWYEINHDCTGSMVLRDDLGNPDFRVELFVGKNGAKVYSVDVNTINPYGYDIPMFIMPIPMDLVDVQDQR